MTARAAGSRLSRRARWTLALATLAGVLGATEIGARIAWRARVPDDLKRAIETGLGLHAAEASATMRYRSHPYLGFTANPEHRGDDGSPTDMEPGLRAQDVDLAHPPPGVIRVVALGGSTTYGYYTPDVRRTWVALAQEELRRRTGEDVEVVNAGVPYYTTYELTGLSALLLPEWKADVVLLSCGANDAFTTWYPDEGGPDGTRFRHAWTWMPPPTWQRAAMRRSVAARLILMRFTGKRGFGLGDFGEVIQHGQPPPDELRRHVAASTGRWFRRNVDLVLTHAERSGSRLVVMTEGLNPSKRSGLGEAYDAVSRAMQRNAAILAGVGRARGAVVIDAQAAMDDAAEFHDAVHQTDEGMRRQSLLVADALEPVIREIARARAERAASTR